MRYSKSKNNALRLLRNQMSSLFLNESVITTQRRARDLKKETEKTLSYLKGNKDTVNTIRIIKSLLYAGAQKKALDEANSILSVKVFKLANRSGDNAPLAKVVLAKKKTVPQPVKKTNEKRKA